MKEAGRKRKRLSVSLSATTFSVAPSSSYLPVPLAFLCFLHAVYACTLCRDDFVVVNGVAVLQRAILGEENVARS